MTFPFELPPLTPNGIIPIWKENGFHVGTEVLKVLKYSTNESGWNDELTFFHEEAAGEQHFIDRASRDHTIQQLKKNIQNNNPVILEIGCSSGFMLKRIIANFPQATVLGSDIISEPLENLANEMPSVPFFRFDLLCCPIPSNTIDAIVILNVLEHIEADNSALEQIFRILKPGGIVIIEVPAGPDLYDVYDKVLMHYRRYQLKQLSKQVEAVGFSILKNSHLGFLMYPGFWITKQKNKKLLSLDQHQQKQYVEKTIKKTSNNRFLHFIMQTELLVGNYLNFPFGIRCLLTCRK